MTDPTSDAQIATAIADRLGETAVHPRRTIARIVTALGQAQALALLDHTVQVEAQGGMRLGDGARRRTPGGVFFKLTKELLDQTGQQPLLRTLFPPWHSAARARSHGAPGPEGAAKAPAPPPASWAERGTWLAGLDDAKGVATTVKVTLIGRPGKVVERNDFTLLLMEHSGPLPSLPKGIPLPSKLPTTTYIVYLAAKHWRTVAEALKAPEDALIVEGVQFYDAEYGAIAVLATNATTKLLQQAKRSSQKP